MALEKLMRLTFDRDEIGSDRMEGLTVPSLVLYGLMSYCASPTYAAHCMSSYEKSDVFQ